MCAEVFVGSSLPPVVRLVRSRALGEVPAAALAGAHAEPRGALADFRHSFLSIPPLAVARPLDARHLLSPVDLVVPGTDLARLR